MATCERDQIARRLRVEDAWLALSLCRHPKSAPPDQHLKPTRYRAKRVALVADRPSPVANHSLNFRKSTSSTRTTSQRSCHRTRRRSIDGSSPFTATFRKLTAFSGSGKAVEVTSHRPRVGHQRPEFGSFRERDPDRAGFHRACPERVRQAWLNAQTPVENSVLSSSTCGASSRSYCSNAISHATCHSLATHPSPSTTRAHVYTAFLASHCTL